MRNKIMILCAFLLMACLCAAAFAATTPEREATGRSNAGPWQHIERDSEVWCQRPDVTNWAKLASQIDTAYPFDAATADEYVSPHDYAVTGITWWGGHWNFAGTEPPCSPDYFVITFYTSDGSCSPPAMSPGPPDFLPENFLHQEIVTSYTETVLDAANSIVQYDAAIGPVLQDVGATYWISIQAGLDFNACGQWGILNSIDTYGCNIARGFPLLGNAYWYNDVDYPSMAFCLYSDLTVSTDETTWDGIKSLFR